MKCSPQTALYLATPNALVLSHLQQRHAYVYATHQPWEFSIYIEQRSTKQKLCFASYLSLLHE